MQKAISFLYIVTLATLTACGAGKQTATSNTTATANTTGNDAQVQKVTAPPPNTQAQKTEILYDK